jgi:hypothetical protein
VSGTLLHGMLVGVIVYEMGLRGVDSSVDACVVGADRLAGVGVWCVVCAGGGGRTVEQQARIWPG